MCSEKGWIKQFLLYKTDKPYGITAFKGIFFKETHNLTTLAQLLLSFAYSRSVLVYHPILFSLSYNDSSHDTA